MNRELLDYLCCPICYGNLQLKATKTYEGEIIEGKLFCEFCNRTYNVSNGIPKLVIRNCFRFSNKLQRALYNIYAPFYDKVERRSAELLGFREEDLRSTIVSAMEIDRGNTVLEVCIGTGSNIPYYRKYTNGLIVGTDISEEMLKVCLNKVKKYKWRRVELVQGCAEYLPFKSNSFDRVLIGGAISYFSDPKRALEEAGRVAKPLAKVVIYEQITILEKLLKKDLLPLRLAPKWLTLTDYSYLFKRHFYLTEFIKQSSFSSKFCYKK